MGRLFRESSQQGCQPFRAGGWRCSPPKHRRMQLPGGQDAEQTCRVRKSVSHPFHSCQKLIDQATAQLSILTHGRSIDRWNWN